MMDDGERIRLDAQYNNRARVANFQEHLDAWAQQSAAFRRLAGGTLDVAYGPGERQAVDVFRPAGEAAAPLLVFIHGGYWQALDRKRFSYVARPFFERGAATAIVGYDLAPAVRVTDIVAQIRRALVFLDRARADLGIDGSGFVIAGHSAGGHLAAMALATDWQRLAARDGLIRGVVALSGLFDLEPIRRCYLNDVLGLDEAEARRLSPVHLPPPRAAVPVLIAVGGAESEAFLDQSARYARCLSQSINSVEHRVEPGLDHFQIAGRFGESGHPLVERTLAMLGR